MHRAAAVACLAAGLFILAGPGWALLALGVLLWGAGPRVRGERSEQQEQAPLDAALARVRAYGRKLRGSAARAAEQPRRTTAVATMVAGATGVPAGVLLTAGTGAAVLTAGALLIGLSVVTGWNA